MVIGGADHGCDRIDHYVARATELDMGARRRRGRQPDRRASPLFVGERVRRLRLRRTADVSVVESTDVGQGNDAAVLGGSTARGSGASFWSARWVREPW